jgi:metal-sulfur cluster biosynthetic enzyme
VSGLNITRESVLEVLRGVDDPELDWNIVDIGLVYRVELVEGGVEVDFTLTYPGCPADAYIREEISESIKRAFEVEPKIRLVWKPLWGPELMSEEARVSLGYPI